MTISTKNLFLFLFILLIQEAAFPATYYVNSSSGSNTRNGTSPSTAWKTISKVNSVHLYPGDNVLFIRGGVWYETLNIKYSGTSSQPITYGSYGSGSLPVINGSLSRTNCIFASGKKYINIKDFRLLNTSSGSGSGAVRIKYSSYITVENCDIYITGRAAVFIEESSYCRILKNTVSTPSTYYNVQTDGIYSQRNSYNTYSGNNIVISNRHTYQHCDGIQAYSDKYGTISSNYIEQKNTKGGNAQGIYCQGSSGTFKIFNNVCYGMYTTSSLIKFKSGGTAQVIGNTIYGGKSQLFVTDDPYIIFKNNIVQTAGTSIPVYFEKAISNKSNINCNIYKRYNNNNAVIKYAGSGKTMSQWKSSGFDVNSMETDPLFVSISTRDFRLKSTSPGINKGIILSAPYNIDKAGNNRPHGTSCDIGAYEYMGLGKDEEILTSTPSEFSLSQNYPNPFNPSTKIKFTLSGNEELSLKVYDILGAQVAEIASGFFSAGSYEFIFDGSELSSGTYIYVLRSKSFVETRKMMLVK